MFQRNRPWPVSKVDCSQEIQEKYETTATVQIGMDQLQRAEERSHSATVAERAKLHLQPHVGGHNRNQIPHSTHLQKPLVEMPNPPHGEDRPGSLKLSRSKGTGMY